MFVFDEINFQKLGPDSWNWIVKKSTDFVFENSWIDLSETQEILI